MKDRCALSTLTDALGMLAALRPRAQTALAKAPAIQMLEHDRRVGHKARGFPKRIAVLILLSQLALIGNDPIHGGLAQDLSRSPTLGARAEDKLLVGLASGKGDNTMQGAGAHAQSHA